VSNLENIIEDIINQNGCELYDTELVSENNQIYFRVFITHKDGVTLDMCHKISKILAPILDVEEPTSSKYIFEVSSPGIDRKLIKHKHFVKSINDRIKFKVNGNKIKGILVSVTKSGMGVSVDGNLIDYNFVDVTDIRTYFDW